MNALLNVNEFLHKKQKPLRKRGLELGNQTDLFCFYQHIERFDTPFFGLLMRVEKHVEAVPFNQTSAVFNLDGLIAVVAGNNHLRSESIPLVGSSKNIARPDSVIAGRDPIRMASAAFAAGTIGRYLHTNHSPFSIFIRLNSSRSKWKFFEVLKHFNKRLIRADRRQHLFSSKTGDRAVRLHRRPGAVQRDQLPISKPEITGKCPQQHCHQKTG